MRLTFGDCVFDSDTREVLREGRPVAISPKAFALLELLIEWGPKAASKADIHARLWPGTHVAEANLANLVAELRAALHDNARQRRVIRTVSRFGYAFTAVTKPVRAKPAETEFPGVACRLIWGRREIALDAGDNLIGRDPDAVVWIDHESVSRRHARILIGDEGATVTDLGSKNGTYVGGRRIRHSSPLRDRDSLKIGPASMVFRVVRRTGSTLSTIEKSSRR
jgi:DNA-binding winged helix-turn-helix (wHTH) protein